MSDLIYPFINFSILIAVLVVYLREPIRVFVRTRHENLRDELQRVRDLLVQAQSKYDEFSGKLKAMDAEIQTMREQAKQDGVAAQNRLLAEAQRLSATIISDSRAASGGLYSQLRHELITDVGLRVLSRAEAILHERLTGDDRVRIRQEFSTQVESAQ
ncbi:ATP synthase F0 subunit B [Bdellovibrionota bacterium FG-1]